MTEVLHPSLLLITRCVRYPFRADGLCLGSRWLTDFRDQIGAAGPTLGDAIPK